MQNENTSPLMLTEDGREFLLKVRDLLDGCTHVNPSEVMAGAYRGAAAAFYTGHIVEAISADFMDIIASLPIPLIPTQGGSPENAAENS